MILLIANPQDPQVPDTQEALQRQDLIFIKTLYINEIISILINRGSEINAIIVGHGPIIDDIDFLTLLTKNETLKDIPLIIVIDDNDQKDIKKFSPISSCHWLQRPIEDHIFRTLILNVTNEFNQRRILRHEIRSRESLIGSIRRGTFHIKTFEQAEALTTMLSLACPEPERIAFGLFELLANAIEHGNLEISHEEKWRLMKDNIHRKEITRRLALPKYKDRYVEIIFERENNLVIFKIEDQGAGFNHNDYVDIDLSLNDTHHGRGIALARATSFDYLEYLATGNKVLAITKFDMA